MGMRGISLRYKFMAALLVIPLVGLSLFLLIAKNIFEKDKIAYVFDSSLSVSKTRAARVSSEVSSVISIAQAIVLSYRSDTKNLGETGTYYFDRETKFEAFQLYAWSPDANNYDRTVNLAKPNGKKLLSGGDKTLQDLVSQARTRPIVVHGLQGAATDRVLLAARFGEVSDPKHVIAVALFEATDLAQIFASEQGPYLSFLSRKSDGQPVFSSLEPGTEWGPEGIWAELADKKTPEGIEELHSGAGMRYLASFSEVGVADLVVVSMVERHAALAAVDVLLRKSFLFFAAIIAMTTILAVIASRGMTLALSRLSAATQKIASGDFGVRVDIQSGGEIGLLATSFNAMAGEVSRLMRETAEKARMESELATAKAVQETLFPESTARIGSVEIAGHYEPASECGGDWWYYCENGDKVYIWVGDATGHGAPAALMTSAARAVASVITIGAPLSPSDCLSILNRAICDTGKGKMMMTFFLACIDTKTGQMAYANASHEPPLLLRQMSHEPKRDDFIPLNGVNSPRVGEQRDIGFKETTIQLEPGDTVAFYTDGVVDVKSPDAKSWGERRFMKSLAGEIHKALHQPGEIKGEAKNALGGVVQTLAEFRGETPLDDDVTLILCRYLGHDQAAKKEAA